MLKIDKTRYVNIQSHEESGLDLSPGFNVVTGPSEGGKTVTMRGDRLLVENKPQGNPWVRKDSNNEPVGTLQVTHEYTNGYKVARVRGKSVNRYIITDPEGKETTLEGFGLDVPDEVLAVTGIRPAVFFDNGKGDRFAPILNFAFQMDAPFLLSETPSLGAKVFGRLAGSEIVDAALSDLNADVYDANRRKRLAEDEITQKEAALTGYEGLDQIRAQFDRSEIMFNTVQADAGRLKQLEALAAELGKVDAGLIRVKGVLEALAFVTRAELKLAGIKLVQNGIERLAGLSVDYTLVNADLAYNNYTLIQLADINALDNALVGIRANQERVARLEDLEDGYRITRYEIGDCKQLLFLLEQVPEAGEKLRQLQGQAAGMDALTSLLTSYTVNEENLRTVTEKLQQVTTVDQAGVQLTQVRDDRIKMDQLADLHIEFNAMVGQIRNVDGRLQLIGDPENAGQVLTKVREAFERWRRLCELQLDNDWNDRELEDARLAIMAADNAVVVAEKEYSQALFEARVCPTCGQSTKPVDEKVKAIVEDLLDDLADRRGLGYEWDKIEPDVKAEIRETWETVVGYELRGGLPNGN